MINNLLQLNTECENENDASYFITSFVLIINLQKLERDR